NENFDGVEENVDDFYNTPGSTVRHLEQQVVAHRSGRPMVLTQQAATIKLNSKLSSASCPVCPTPFKIQQTSSAVVPSQDSSTPSNRATVGGINRVRTYHAQE
ncbi:hypothetical protein ACLOJK_039220, partial [Asimina triloba]